MIKNYIKVGKRKIGEDFPPFVIAEIGINHEGKYKKAKKMVDDAAKAGCECVKFQSHIIEDEMVPQADKVIPGNAKESIYAMMKRCSLSETEELRLKKYVEKKNMLYLCTPFSRAAADRLNRMGVGMYKIGSGECNNYPLIEHIARYRKPMIISTGMNSIKTIKKSVEILKKYKTPYILLHCTSMYPTPYNKVRLGALEDLRRHFPNVILGLSDHSLGIYTTLAAVSLGASVVEKHFTSNMSWKGSDISISITPKELKDLIIGSKAIWEARGGKKNILKEEQPTINFAYACVVSTENIKKGERFTSKNIWVKRPGTGEIKAVDYNKIIDKIAKVDINKDSQIKWSQIEESNK